MKPRQVAVLGLGLMGSSLGLALRARGRAGRVTAYARREETRREGQRRGVADAFFDDPADAVRGADTVVLCVPILTISAVMEQCRTGLERDAVVTDVGSTKRKLVEACAPIARSAGAWFVGSHPIAGSERHGLEAGQADLYDGATTVVTPAPGDPDAMVRRVCELWAAVGSATCVMTPEAHDRMLARTSHMPHLVAAALVAAVARDDAPDRVGPFCGSGFRDATRIAEGSPEVWDDIVRTNMAPVLDELRACGEAIDRLRARVEAGDFESIKGFLEQARADRRALMKRSPYGGA